MLFLLVCHFPFGPFSYNEIYCVGVGFYDVGIHVECCALQIGQQYRAEEQCRRKETERNNNNEMAANMSRIKLDENEPVKIDVDDKRHCFR